MKIARVFQFEASHQLPCHDGKCQRLHGHTYRLELVLEGPVRVVDAADPQSGFVADFGLIDRLVRLELLDPFLDHHHLNDHLPGLPYPSAENLAAWIAAWAMIRLEGRPELGAARFHAARLWESPNAWAEAGRDDALPLAAAHFTPPPPFDPPA